MFIELAVPSHVHRKFDIVDLKCLFVFVKKDPIFFSFFLPIILSSDK